MCSAVTGQRRMQAGLSLTSCDASKGPGLLTMVEICLLKMFMVLLFALTT